MFNFLLCGVGWGRFSNENPSVVQTIPFLPYFHSVLSPTFSYKRISVVFRMVLLSGLGAT